jgi:hypothetical protein
VGRRELEALAAIIQQQLATGPGNAVSGTWTITYDKSRDAFTFGKCEFGGYCEERPSVIAINGDVLDPGGPISQEG